MVNAINNGMITAAIPSMTMQHITMITVSPMKSLMTIWRPISMTLVKPLFQIILFKMSAKLALITIKSTRTSMKKCKLTWKMLLKYRMTSWLNSLTIIPSIVIQFLVMTLKLRARSFVMSKWSSQWTLSNVSCCQESSMINNITTITSTSINACTCNM